MIDQIAYNAATYNLTPLQKYKSVELICHLEQARCKAILHQKFLEKYQSHKVLNREEKEEDIKLHYSPKFSTILASVSKETKFIIENEFLSAQKNKLWWENYCSRSTYYKRRSHAISEFLYFYVN